MDAEVGSCSTCRFFQASPNQVTGRCRRFPPAHRLNDRNWEFPLVEATSGCGEWRALLASVLLTEAVPVPDYPGSPWTPNLHGHLESKCDTPVAFDQGGPAEGDA